MNETSNSSKVCNFISRVCCVHFWWLIESTAWIDDEIDEQTQVDKELDLLQGSSKSTESFQYLVWSVLIKTEVEKYLLLMCFCESMNKSCELEVFALIVGRILYQHFLT